MSRSYNTVWYCLYSVLYYCTVPVAYGCSLSSSRAPSAILGTYSELNCFRFSANLVSSVVNTCHPPEY
jgi:hypothetical protein